MKKPVICSACAHDNTEIEFVGGAVHHHWFCTYSRPNYGQVTRYDQCKYFEDADDLEEGE